MAELSEAGGEHLVARRKRIGKRRFPAAGAGGWEDEYLTGDSLKDLLQILQQARCELREPGRAMVFHRDHHRPLHTFGNVRRPGNEQKITARYAGSHRSSPLVRLDEKLPAGSRSSTAATIGHRRALSAPCSAGGAS